MHMSMDILGEEGDSFEKVYASHHAPWIGKKKKHHNTWGKKRETMRWITPHTPRYIRPPHPYACIHMPYLAWGLGPGGGEEWEIVLGAYGAGSQRPNADTLGIDDRSEQSR